MARTIFPATALLVVTLMSVGERAVAQVPPAPAGVQADQTINLPRPAPPANARAVELWQDKPLGELKASINLAESEKLNKTEVARLDQAAPMLAAHGYTVSVFGESRPWMLNTYEWEAPATRHLPLLFEEPNLERLGYRSGVRTWWGDCESIHAGNALQPFISAAHFFGRVPAIPYLCGVDDPWDPIYTLGVDRPGTPVLYRRHFIPWSYRGALYEAGFVLGLAYAIP